MKTLTKKAERIFRQLIAGLASGEARRIDNHPGSGIMAVSVDCLATFPNGAALYAVAHRFEMNGDLCPDPDVEFYVTSLGVAPTAIDHAPPFGYKRYVETDQGQITRYNRRGQADLTSFCSTWMENIKAQQGDLTPPAAPVVMVADETERTEVTPVETMSQLVHGSRS